MNGETTWHRTSPPCASHLSVTGQLPDCICAVFSAEVEKKNSRGPLRDPQLGESRREGVLEVGKKEALGQSEPMQLKHWRSIGVMFEF